MQHTHDSGQIVGQGKDTASAANGKTKPTLARNSGIIYRSFYDAIDPLPEECQLPSYRALFEYLFNGNEIELPPIPQAIFTLIKPQLDANIAKYENGKKGGRPKSKKPNQNQEETKQKPNQNQTGSKPKGNANDNVNVNDNVNDNSNKNKKVNITSSGKKMPGLGYKECVDVWLKEIHPDFQFGDMQGKKMKSLIAKINKSISDNGQDVTAENISTAFQVMCKNLPDWYKNKDLAKIDSGYNEIISQIKNPQNGNSFAKNSSRQSADSYK